jgi:hypothetical protein
MEGLLHVGAMAITLEGRYLLRGKIVQSERQVWSSRVKDVLYGHALDASGLACHRVSSGCSLSVANV